MADPEPPKRIEGLVTSVTGSRCFTVAGDVFCSATLLPRMPRLRDNVVLMAEPWTSSISSEEWRAVSVLSINHQPLRPRTPPQTVEKPADASVDFFCWLSHSTHTVCTLHNW